MLNLFPIIVFQVCVHVVDMTFYLTPGSAADKEARQRGCCVFPVSRPAVPMLPPALADTCCLEPDAVRCALSVLLTVAGSGEEWQVCVQIDNLYALVVMDSVLLKLLYRH